MLHVRYAVVAQWQGSRCRNAMFNQMLFLIILVLDDSYCSPVWLYLNLRAFD